MGVIPQGKSPKIQYLRPHHRSMARMMVQQGLTPTQLATAFGFSPAQISIITNSPLFQVELRRLEDMADLGMVDVGAELKALQPRALEVLSEDLHKPGIDPKIRNNTALEILDRTGFGKKDGVQRHLHLHGHLHKQEVEKMDKKELYNEVLDLVGDDVG